MKCSLLLRGFYRLADRIICLCSFLPLDCQIQGIRGGELPPRHQLRIYDPERELTRTVLTPPPSSTLSFCALPDYPSCPRPRALGRCLMQSDQVPREARAGRLRPKGSSCSMGDVASPYEADSSDYRGEFLMVSLPLWSLSSAEV